MADCRRSLASMRRILSRLMLPCPPAAPTATGQLAMSRTGRPGLPEQDGPAIAGVPDRRSHHSPPIVPPNAAAAIPFERQRGQMPSAGRALEADFDSKSPQIVDYGYTTL